MPVLTCPFVPVPAANVPRTGLFFPGTSVSTQLAIKPTAGESWDVEGLSIAFTVRYQAQYLIKIEAAYKSLKSTEAVIVKQEEALAITKAALESRRAAVESERNNLILAQEVVEGKGETLPTYEKRAAVRASEAAIAGVNQELSALNEAKEGYVRDLFQIQRELAELGTERAQEGSKAPVLIVLARLYARSNELVWTSQLEPIRILSNQRVYSSEKYTVSEAEVTESFNLHEQFDDPIDFTERENLTLTLQLIGPAEITELEGANIPGPIVFPAIQPIVNYSRHTEGERR
jgi:hypothetical protein